MHHWTRISLVPRARRPRSASWRDRPRRARSPPARAVRQRRRRPAPAPPERADVADVPVCRRRDSAKYRRRAAASRARPRRARNQRASALSRHAVQPSLLTRPVGHRVRGDHRARRRPTSARCRRCRRSPRRARSRSSASSALGASRQATTRIPVSPNTSSGLALPARQLRPVHEVGLAAPRRERARSRVGEVESRLRVPALPQHVERPDDAGRAAVEVLHRQRRLPAVPLVRRPQVVAAVRGIGVRDDRADRVADAPLVPRLVRQRLECPPAGRARRRAYRVRRRLSSFACAPRRRRRAQARARLRRRA